MSRLGISRIFRVHHVNVLFIQRCTNPGRQVAMATEFCTVASNICVFSVRNLLHVTLLVPIILRWLRDVCKMCGPLYLVHLGLLVRDLV